MAVSNVAVKLCVAGVTGTALLAGDPALAERQPIEVTARINPDVRNQVVSFHDLDLLQAADQKMLSRRVGRAVGTVCEPYEPASYSRSYNMCRVGAWRGARPQMALAVQRAKEIAATGTSSIPAAAIVVAAP